MATRRRPARALALLAAACGLVPAGVAAGTATTSAAAAGQASVPLIPRSVLFGNPERASVQVSPDGSMISYLAPLDGVLNVWIRPVGGGEAAPITRSERRPIRRYAWSWNGEQVLYLQDEGGDENTSIFAVDVITGEETNLTPQEGVRASILAAHRDRPDELLVLMNDRDPRMQDVLRLNTRTGETERIVENAEGWIGYVPDDEWHVRGRARMTGDGGMEVQMRESDHAEWVSFLRVPMEDTGNFGLLGLSADGADLFLTDPSGRDTSALVAVDPATGDRRTLFASEASDIADVLINPLTRRPEAVATKRLRKRWTVLDDAVRGDLAALDAAIEGEIEITDRSGDDRTWIVAAIDDDGPVRYWRWDRDAQEAHYLFSNRPALEDLPLVEMRAVEIETRDGLSMPSYLSRPRNADGPVPMVLLVHGGPWARDDWGYSPYHQWLANRGYAVLSANFRGSTGFGKAFLNAGNREWYGRMQDDLVDAVRWAIDEGVADPERVAIMGGSYGGYAALAGLTRDPEVFACGISIVGPSHVRTLLQTIPPYWEPMRAMFAARVGSLAEPEYLDSISPLTHVANIEDPLLIGQGANDPRVKISESDQIVEAMNERDIPVTYVVFPDEGHGFARPENSMAFNAIAEAFLAEHLGGRAEPLAGDVAESSAQVRELGELSLPGVERWTGEAVADAGDEDGAGAAEEEIRLEDLPAARQAQARQVIDRMRRQLEDDPAAAGRILAIAGLLEGQVARSQDEEERRMARYIVQELRKMADGG